jgi:hypothetical protein
MVGRRRHLVIAQRKRIYIGCEGRTEVEYTGFLQDRVDVTHKKFYLVRKDLGGGGNPVAMLGVAVRDRIRQANLGAFIGSAVLLDADTADDRTMQEANDFARREGFTLIWQRPCGEAFLLEHIGQLSQPARNSSREARDRFRAVFGKDAPLDRMDLRRHFEPIGESIFDATRVSNRALADLLEVLEL